MNDKALAKQDSQAAIIERVMLVGDLGRLEPWERVEYYTSTCESLGLNPLTRPFEYLKLNNRLTLYARKDATDQLRRVHSVSIKISSREQVGGCYVVVAQATTKDGRTDESLGAVPTDKLRGDNLANALMKAETKAKRRVTLSICGLGFTDESELETIKGAERVSVDEAHQDKPTQAELADAEARMIAELADIINEEIGKLWYSKNQPLITALPADAKKQVRAAYGSMLKRSRQNEEEPDYPEEPDHERQPGEEG
jgi:hypothetical protein